MAALEPQEISLDKKNVYYSFTQFWKLIALYQGVKLMFQAVNFEGFLERLPDVVSLSPS